MSAVTSREFTIDPELPVTETVMLETSELRHGDLVSTPQGLFHLQAAISGGWYVTVGTDTLNPVPLAFPAGRNWEVRRPVYAVEFRDLDRKELVRVEFPTELDAVRAAGSYRLYVNTELVAVGPNVDSDKFTS